MESYRRQMQNLATEYERATGKAKYSSAEVARWAIDNRRWGAPEKLLIRVCAEDISRALREEYTTDKQGRRVRTKHAIPVDDGGEQTALWGDMRRVSREHMQLAFGWRRRIIVSECKQLNNDVDSYNDNHNPGAPLNYSFDFTGEVRSIQSIKRAISANEHERPSQRFLASLEE